ncbi:hypothetical protein SAMN06273572_103156 [Monaibacterium marinum]|uniref:Lipoprotein n=1 Tax=Pontivivens marinum TaxID=1690039 RepID=A0A2C9CUQ1_9RHOB|nr:hypothetical protein [Monaibacterium marinum]SOH94129.1 hypothetical protein SAMN06273572_103156 [Monaibacterium marinum]
MRVAALVLCLSLSGCIGDVAGAAIKITGKTIGVAADIAGTAVSVVVP